LKKTVDFPELLWYNVLVKGREKKIESSQDYRWANTPCGVRSDNSILKPLDPLSKIIKKEIEK
jgi:hypothetical protein